MRVTGSLNYALPPEAVYQTFTDRKALLYSTPGLRNLNELAAGQYDATMTIGLGGFELVYQGKLTLTDQIPPRQCRFLINATTQDGYGRGDVLFRFLPGQGGGTRVEYEADLELGGRQTLLPSLARGLVAYFMHGMEHWMERTRGRSHTTT